ncbi:MAG: peptidylprolyl isomerase [Thermodesulfobacteriota bacterium]
MTKSKIIIAVFLAFVLALSADARAKERVDGIAIVINNSIVTLSEYNRRADRVRQRAPQASKDDIVNNIISETLIFQEAAKRNIKTSPEELQAATADFKKSQGLDDAGFVKTLTERNLTMDGFFREMSVQILTRKLVQYEVSRSGLSIDDKKVEEYYRQKNPDADSSAQVRIAHILLPSVKRNSLEAAEKIALEAKKEGANFPELAAEHSIDERTAARGGDLGYFKYDELIKPLQEAVDGAEPGDVNGPVKSGAGFHIVRVIAVKDSGVIVPPELKNSLIEEMAFLETERIISSVIEEGFSNSLIDLRI